MLECPVPLGYHGNLIFDGMMYVGMYVRAYSFPCGANTVWSTVAVKCKPSGVSG